MCQTLIHRALLGSSMKVQWLALVLAMALMVSLCRASTFDTDLLLTVGEERECHGTSVGFGFSGTREYHYQQLRKRYDGCTYVHGNLEITNLNDPVLTYDLDFLSSIKYVSGYVLIGLSGQVDQIQLTNLEMIRGNETYEIQGESCSLIVAMTSRATTPVMGMRHLYMPKLKEISNGKVMFAENPLLSNMDTIAWEIITRGDPDRLFLLHNAFLIQENGCQDVCELDGTPLCWGDKPYLCQDVVVAHCNATCGWRCYEAGNCCNPNCAVGCTGPGPQDCLMCKDYLLDNECVGFCPARTYPKLQSCVRF